MYTRLTRSHICGPRLPRLLRVKNILNNYFAMSDALPYTRGTCLHRRLGVMNYFNNYFAMYKRLIRSRIRVELASPAYLGLRII